MIVGDLAFVDMCARVQTPTEVLELFHNYRDFVGTDPYYRNLNNAMWEALDRVLSKQPRSTPQT